MVIGVLMIVILMLTMPNAPVKLLHLAIHFHFLLILTSLHCLCQWIEAEAWQMGLYGPGGHYLPHFDAFDTLVSQELFPCHHQWQCQCHR